MFKWLSLALVLSLPAAGNLDWRNEYNAGDGRPCCHEHDCTVVPESQPSPVLGAVVVTEKFGPVLINAVHPSRDDKIWVCHTGCAFVPWRV